MTEPPDPSPVTWRDGAPRSALYGDIYYSLEDGLAETQAVFLAGCGLPQAWRGRTAFTVAELGFGSGLNIAALLDLWAQARPAGAHLNIFSIEAHPMPREDAARALGAWPQIAPAAQALLDRWPGTRRGFHRIDLPQFAATLDLAVMEAGQALRDWSGPADAWFLDGFSPALNPAMWREEVLALVAARSAPGARLATFTVAGAVRRGLQAQGFEVQRAPGHGRKRERLEARLPGEAKPPREPGRVVIIGAGIAGAAAARAFTAMGRPVTVIEGTSPPASMNPAALVSPALDAGGDARARFYAQAFARAADLYRAQPEAVIATGVVRLESGPRDPRRFDAICVQDIFEPGTVRRLTPPQAAEALGEPAAPGGLFFIEGLVVEPEALLAAWLPSQRIADDVESLEALEKGWRLRLASGAQIEAGAVVLAGGWAGAALLPALGLLPVRGQASWTEAPAVTPAAFGGYAIPTRGGVLFGATHDRGQADAGLRAEDHARNLAVLAEYRPGLAGRLDPARLEGRAGVRAATRDRLPLAGEVRPGLFVLSGLGSRGFSTAPLLGEHVAALALGAPSPLTREGAGLVDPARH